MPWVSPPTLHTGDLPNAQHYRMSRRAERNVLWGVSWRQWNCLVQTEMYLQWNSVHFSGVRLCVSSTSTSLRECNTERGTANGDARNEFSISKVNQYSANVAASRLPNYRQYSYPTWTATDVFPYFRVYYLQSSDQATLLNVRVWGNNINPLKPELNPICYLLALLGAHHFLHVSRIRVKLLTLRLLMSYIYGAPILDVSRSHTTTQHSR